MFDIIWPDFIERNYKGSSLQGVATWVASFYEKQGFVTKYTTQHDRIYVSVFNGAGVKQDFGACVRIAK